MISNVLVSHSKLSENPHDTGNVVNTTFENNPTNWIQKVIEILKILIRSIQMTIYITPLLLTAPVAIFVNR